MLKRLPGFVTLVTLLLCIAFLPGYSGYAVFFIAAMCLTHLATQEICNLFERIGFHNFPGFATRFSYLIVFAVFVMGIDKIIPATWEKDLGFDASGHQILEMLPLFLIAVIAVIPWVALPVIGTNVANIKRMLTSVLATLMITFPLGLLVYLYSTVTPVENSCIAAPLFLFVVACTKIGDTGAYLVGSIANRINGGRNHKIAPSISPNKSWEGAIGGMIASTLLAYFLKDYALPEFSDIATCIAGALLFWGGFFGDLAESVLKRIADVKDSGQLFPGMGGALDFLDALLIAVPLFVIYYLIMCSYTFIRITNLSIQG